MNKSQIELNILHHQKLLKLDRKLFFKFLILSLFCINVINISFINFMPFLSLFLGSFFLICTSLIYLIKTSKRSKAFDEKLYSSKGTYCSYMASQRESFKQWLLKNLKMYLITSFTFLVIFLIDADFSKIGIPQVLGVLFLSFSIGTMVYSVRKDEQIVH